MKTTPRRLSAEYEDAPHGDRLEPEKQREEQPSPLRRMIEAQLGRLHATKHHKKAEWEQEDQPQRHAKNDPSVADPQTDRHRGEDEKDESKERHAPEDIILCQNRQRADSATPTS